MKTKVKSTQKSSLFLAGLGLFVVGIFGGLFTLYQTYFKHIDEIVGDDFWFYTEVDLSVKQLKALQGHFSGNGEVLETLAVHEELDFETLSPWVKHKVAFGLLNDGHFVGGAKYRNRIAAEKFMSSFLLPDERIESEETSVGTIYTPAYSSQRAFLFYRGWLIWSDSKYTLMEVLSNEEKLNDEEHFEALKKDLPKGKLFTAFVNLTHWEPRENLDSDIAAYRPLLQAFGSVIPAFGVVVELEDDRLIFNSKALTHEGVYDANDYKVTNSTVPDLAYFSPKNSLLFLNGAKVFDKYKHTQEFLSTLDPQLALVFEGVIRAQSNEIFGEGFDYENNILAYLNQNYSLIMDFENQLDFGFVAQIEANNGNKEAIKSAILKAQARFEPTPEVVELPDGTERTELVAKDISTIPVENKKVGDYDYYVVKGLNDDGFSYAFIDHYFVFANNSGYLEKLLQTYLDQKLSLAENRDFRQSVLFDFKSAESYGFMNMPKVFALWDWMNVVEEASQSLEAAEEDTVSTWEQLQPYVRNVTFSRMVYPGEAYIQGNIFLNN